MMADNYKILAQDVAVSIEENSNQNQANVIYTVPANTQAAISSISLINSSETDEDYYLGVVKAEDVEDSGTPAMAGQFVAVARETSEGAYSADGITWTSFNFPGWNYWSSVAYGNGKFVAVANFSSVSAYSADGITWTLTSQPHPNLSSVTYADNKFVAVGPSGTPQGAAYSTDGVSWTISPLSVDTWSSVAYGNGKFVATSFGTFGFGTPTDHVAYSIDGAASWTPINTGSLGIWPSITYGDGKFVAVSYNSAIAIYSTDGITWTQSNLPISGTWQEVTYGNGKFVAVATNLAVYSTDGIAWTEINNIPMGSWSSVAYGGGKFIAVTDMSSVGAYSTDGITWTQTSMPAIARWSSAGYRETIESKKIISDAQTIIPTRSIAPNAVDEISGGITLSAGDQIRVYSESPDLIVQVYGVEIA